jgi:hypothetical protein
VVLIVLVSRNAASNVTIYCRSSWPAMITITVEKVVCELDALYKNIKDGDKLSSEKCFHCMDETKLQALGTGNKYFFQNWYLLILKIYYPGAIDRFQKTEVYHGLFM